jgi:hypothetical protein
MRTVQIRVVLIVAVLAIAAGLGGMVAVLAITQMHSSSPTPIAPNEVPAAPAAAEEDSSGLPPEPTAPVASKNALPLPAESAAPAPDKLSKEAKKANKKKGGKGDENPDDPGGGDKAGKEVQKSMQKVLDRLRLRPEQLAAAGPTAEKLTSTMQTLAQAEEAVRQSRFAARDQARENGLKGQEMQQWIKNQMAGTYEQQLPAMLKSVDETTAALQGLRGYLDPEQVVALDALVADYGEKRAKLTAQAVGEDPKSDKGPKPDHGDGL